MRPRTYIKAAFKMVYARFGIFCMYPTCRDLGRDTADQDALVIGGALAVGIVCPSRDPKLADVVLNGSSGSAEASPYVIAMNNLGITVLPDIVNAYAGPSLLYLGSN